MKTIPASEYPAQDWPRPSPLRKPYTFHRVRVDATDSDPAERDPDQSERDWQLAVHHLRGPIQPHLSRLVPGDIDSIVKFVERLGLDELAIWGMTLESDKLNEPWHRLYADLTPLDNGVATVPQTHLSEAWASAAVPFAEEQTRLDEAYRYAARSEGADQTIRFLRDHWRSGPRGTHLKTRTFPHPEIDLVTWPIKPVDDAETLAIVESPAHILARAWLELYDHLQANGAPKICKGCQSPFIGTRSDQEYCTRECQLQSHGKDRRNRDSYRREYERMYQQKRRGTITDAQFAAWKKRQGRG